MRILVHRADKQQNSPLGTATAGPPQGGLVGVKSPDYANARNPRKVTEHSPVNSLHVK